MKYIALLVLIGTFFGCSSQSSLTPESQNTLINCPEQRPQVCTMGYSPVCATRDTGVRCITTPCPSTEQKTYSNGCSACADIAVIGYVVDECPSSAIQ